LTDARTLFARGILHTHQDEHRFAGKVFAEVLGITRAAGDRSGQAQALRGLAICHHHFGDADGAVASLTAALEMVRGSAGNFIEKLVLDTAAELGYRDLVVAARAR